MLPTVGSRDVGACLLLTLLLTLALLLGPVNAKLGVDANLVLVASPQVGEGIHPTQTNAKIFLQSQASIVSQAENPNVFVEPKMKIKCYFIDDVQITLWIHLFLCC